MTTLGSLFDIYPRGKNDKLVGKFTFIEKITDCVSKKYDTQTKKYVIFKYFDLSSLAMLDYFHREMFYSKKNQ